jgi:predicted phosphoadenosine phosphosulfate sulfurtransferase
MGKQSVKIYQEENVYDAAVRRVAAVFDHFSRVCVAFSGGKDSGVLLHLCMAEARKRKRKIGVLFIDLEAFYQLTIEFVTRMIDGNRDVLEPFWVCLPMESPNSVSYLDPTWIWWQPEKEPIWVRPMPDMDCVCRKDRHPFPFYRENMPFEKFVHHFGEWYGQEAPAALMIGIRTDESLARYRALTCSKETYLDWIHSTRNGSHSYNFYPLYDWRTEDIWTYNGKYKKDYNRLYDLFYRAGVGIHKMRVDEPFGNEAKAGLNLFRVIEPATWARVVNRVSGANFGNLYGNSKLTTGRYQLPKGHSWKSFTRFLLTTLPPETAAHYRKKFIKFIRWWHRNGSPMMPESIAYLEQHHPDDIINTGQFSARGLGDKTVVRFVRVMDEVPELDRKQDLPTWRRMAMCIIKNDFLCKSLSFGVTKDLTIRQKELLEKYKNL